MQLIVTVAGTVAIVVTLFYTQRAANAAKLAAEAIPLLERAHIYPVITDDASMTHVIRNAAVFYIDDPIGKEDTPADETAEITFYVKNFGKTPAIIKAVWVAVGVSPIDDWNLCEVPESIIGSGDSTSPLTAEMNVGITRTEAMGIDNYIASLVFDGIIIFKDIWGTRHQTDFVFKWNKTVKKMILDDVRTKELEKD